MQDGATVTLTVRGAMIGPALAVFAAAKASAAASAGAVSTGKRINDRNWAVALAGPPALGPRLHAVCEICGCACTCSASTCGGSLLVSYQDCSRVKSPAHDSGGLVSANAKLCGGDVRVESGVNLLRWLLV